MGSSTRQPRRGDTRLRIQEVALELFGEQGYEKTSLREIAERLDVTKAALYYHFKTKEDILVTLFEGVETPVNELIAWAKEQPRTLETKQEIIRRYGETLVRAAPVFRFMQENQGTVRDLKIGESFKARVLALVDLLKDPDAKLTSHLRCFSALTTMHAGTLLLNGVEGDPEEKHAAVLEVALDLIAQAHENR
ncbi:TetR/AcrR family transcriptional regulator [Streptomyces sp. NPDC050504]|uniref:TetR/AcrR family transcriptional regulator n=1 Tax=Streptomyces sp. NPDC050504 TaxID=3365618 RepID=UPI003795779E